MKKKGFTLIELLVVIVIIGLISGIAIISYNNIFNTAEQKYYNTLESNILLAGNDYFEDHRRLLPIGVDIESVQLTDLIAGKYIEPIKDIHENVCTDGKVFAYRENNKFKYEVCIKCGDYESTGKFCNHVVSKKINVRGWLALSNTSYNVENSYTLQEYSKGENVIVELSMKEEYPVTRYLVENTNDKNIKKECIVESNNKCNVEIEKSGTYKVIAYNGEEEISNKYINVKIAKGKPDFTTDIKPKYPIEENECSIDKKEKKVVINITKNKNEEYKSVKYQIRRYSLNDHEEEIETIVAEKNLSRLQIEENLESGHYKIDIVVTNYSNDDVALYSQEFDVTYFIKLEREDGSSIGRHEVVKDQSYDYISELPKKNEDGILYRWFKNNDRIYSSNVIQEGCSFVIIGKTTIPVAIENFSNYCRKEEGKDGLYYTGNEEILTITAPANVVFSNNKGTIVNTYTVKASLSSSGYIWEDETVTDKVFSCKIIKAINPMEIEDNQIWETDFSTNIQNHEFIGATKAVGNVTYAINSQKNSSGTTINNFSISGTTLTMARSTSIGTYTVVIRATAAGNANYESEYKDITMTVKVLNTGLKIIERINASSCTAGWVDDMETPDNNNDDMVYFSGTSDCVNFNYVWYSGKLWRIIAIYPDGAMKLVTDKLMTGISYNSTDNPNFYTNSSNQSYIYQWLNQDFLSTLYNYQNIIDTSKKWNVTNSNATVRTDIKKRLPNTSMVTANVGLLNSYEYYNSFRCVSKTCDGSITTSGYLNLSFYQWLINPCTDTHPWQVFSDAVMPDENYARTYYRMAGVRPSIVIKSSVKFTGDGTVASPYRITIDKNSGNVGELINTRISGEFVKFDNSDDADVFRIVGIENDKTKIVMYDYFDNLAQKPFATSRTNGIYWGKGATTNEGTWYYHLTNIYLPSLKIKYGNIFDSGTYYTAKVNRDVNYNYKEVICTNDTLEPTSTCTKTASSDTFEIGVLRYGEMFAETQEKIKSGIGRAMILITPYGNDSIVNVGNNGHLYGASVNFGGDSQLFWNVPGAKPTLHLKSTVKIKSGQGTKDNPYVVGL